MRWRAPGASLASERSPYAAQHHPLRGATHAPRNELNPLTLRRRACTEIRRIIRNAGSTAKFREHDMQVSGLLNLRLRKAFRLGYIQRCGAGWTNECRRKQTEGENWNCRIIARLGRYRELPLRGTLDGCFTLLEARLVRYRLRFRCDVAEILLEREMLRCEDGGGEC